MKHNSISPPKRKAYKWSIPTQYAGILMRSKLETAWANFFDVHRIRWAYEPEGFHIGDVFYLPDFYLPEIRVIAEVKGVLDEDDMEKLRAIVTPAAERGIMTVLLEPGRWRLCNPSPQLLKVAADGPEFLGEGPFNPETDISVDLALARCRECRRWYFIDSSLDWTCTACGFSEGNMTFDLVHPMSEGWPPYECPDCENEVSR